MKATRGKIMKYVTLDILDNGEIKHKDWVCDGVCSKYGNLFKFIVEEETEHFLNQPERSKRDEYDREVCEHSKVPNNCHICGALIIMET